MDITAMIESMDEDIKTLVSVSALLSTVNIEETKEKIEKLEKMFVLAKTNLEPKHPAVVMGDRFMNSLKILLFAAAELKKISPSQEECKESLKLFGIEDPESFFSNSNSPDL